MISTDANPPTILAIHGSASTGKQWRFLAQATRGRACVLSPDLPGYGKATFDHANRFGRLSRLIHSVSSPVHLVGHSFGGTIALRLANAHPQKVASVTLYDPIAFVKDTSGDPRLPKKLDDLLDGLRIHAPQTSMQRFVDFWNGAGSWDGLTGIQKERLMGHYSGLLRDMDEIGSGLWTAPQADYQGPLTLFRGEWSPDVAKDMANAIAVSHPRIRVEVLPKLGHLSPLTQATETLGHWLRALEDHGAIAKSFTSITPPCAA